MLRGFMFTSAIRRVRAQASGASRSLGNFRFDGFKWITAVA